VATFFTTNAVRWQSPLSTHVLGGADLSIPVGMLVAGGAYYVLARREPAQQAAPVAESARVGA
jgi:hypothetical protein